jgi:HAE1 family hydrophobic/amphiphilic exporter-1
LYAALLLSALLMYTVLAVEFESLLFPLIIMFSVPLGLIGAVLTLFVAGASLNVVSLMGLVILIGIADNDAVVKVETILAKRAAGLPLREAIVAAGQERFRPIVMNSLTVMFGLVPMMFGSGAATQLRASLSLAVVGGLLTATALTLVVIPVLYALAERLQERLRGS